MTDAMLQGSAKYYTAIDFDQWYDTSIQLIWNELLKNLIKEKNN